MRPRTLKSASAALALVGASVAALPANALSCLRPDPVRLYEQARDSEDRFRIVHGTLNPIGEIREQQADPGQAETDPVLMQARLEGLQLGPEGFSYAFDEDVTVELVCYSAWCGQFPGTEPMLMAVEERAGALVVTSDPCYGRLYNTPTPADLDRVLACHEEGDCVLSDG